MNRRLLCSVGLVVLSRSVFAQATPLVPPDARVYRDIDRLAAAGLIDTLIAGTRPFSEREIVRLLGEAKRNLERNPRARAWAESAIAADVARYTRPVIRPYDDLRVEGGVLGSPYRHIDSDRNGTIDASINPLAGYRGGRPIADGGTAAIESSHSLLLGSHLSAAVNPRATILWPRNDDGGESELRLQTGALQALFGNVSLEAGRDYMVFGQSPDGGLLLSNNAPPLDMVRMGNDAPFVLPWLLRFAGPIRTSVFVSDLGPNRQIHPHARLAGYHISFLPHPQFEIGVEVVDGMGGRGGQAASFGDRVADAVPLIDAFFRTHSDFEFSNKMAGGDFHWRVPSWRGFELYFEGAIDDFDYRRLKSVFLEDGGYIVGTSLTCLAECGRFGVRAEYHQTGIRYYTHGDYPMEKDGVLLGDPLGPRGLGAYLTLDGELGAGEYWSLTSAFEVRSGNEYGSEITGAKTTGFHFVQTLHRPGEKRARTVLTWIPERRAGRGRISPTLSVGVERVTNADFNLGMDRTNWLARAGLVLRP
ncbi:MAG: capsule assembly Wzi family protein [bacterium]